MIQSLNNQSLQQQLSCSDQPQNAKLKKVCNDFVSILYSQMMTSMQDAMKVEGGILEDKGGYKDFSNYLFNQIMSKEVIKQSGEGLAGKLYDQLSGNIK